MPSELIPVRGIWPSHAGTNATAQFPDQFAGWWCSEETSERSRWCVECRDGLRDAMAGQDCPVCPVRVAPGSVVARAVTAVYAPVGARIAVVSAEVELHAEDRTVVRLTVGRVAPSSRERLPWFMTALAGAGPDWVPRTVAVCTRDATAADGAQMDEFCDDIGARPWAPHVYAEPMAYGAGGPEHPGTSDVLAALLAAWPDPDAEPDAVPVPNPWSGCRLDVGAVRGPKYAVDALAGEITGFRAGRSRAVMNPDTGDRHDALLLATAAGVYFARRYHQVLTAQADDEVMCPVHEDAGLL